LKILAILADLRLTLGSLRGGGAVEAYRSGAELAKLCCRMRLKSFNGLEHYIQEVAVDSFLVSLEPHSQTGSKSLRRCLSLACWFSQHLEPLLRQVSVRLVRSSSDTKLLRPAPKGGTCAHFCWLDAADMPCFD
jgi:hypothetical protein